MFKKTAHFLLPLIILLAISISSVRADDLLDIQNQIDQKNSLYWQTQQSLDQIKKDIAYLSSSIYSTAAEAEEANKKVAEISSELSKVEDDLNSKKNELRSIVEIRDRQIRQFYKHPGDNPLELFINAGGFSDFTQGMAFQKRVLGTSKGIIESVNKEVIQVEKTRKE